MRRLLPLLPLLAACSGGAEDPAADDGGGAEPGEAQAAAPEVPFEAYEQGIPESEVSYRMLPIPGGTFLMGSPEGEAGMRTGEGPPHEVQVSPFWMAELETGWEAYRLYQFDQVPEVDGVTGPTPPYVPMDFGMGLEGYPAISMTHYAARQYCKWLTAKTGHFHRLPTEAEWEYACRAGTTTAFSFGDDPAGLAEHGVWWENSDGKYDLRGQRPANAFGLKDMHGNVAEWVMDGYDSQLYATRAAAGETVVDPVNWPKAEWGRVVRGGGWDDDPEQLRSAARKVSKPGWKARDPQLPKSIWYLTDAPWLGFRVVRPLNPPPPEEWERWWEPGVPAIQEIQDRQARGER